MKKIVFILIGLVIVSFIFNCGKTQEESEQIEKKENSKIEKNEKSGNKDEIDTQKEFEAKLSELGLSIYEGAVFKEVQKRKYGDGYQIIYTIDDTSQEKVEEVNKFYLKKLKIISENRGWEQVKGLGNILMFRDPDSKEIKVNITSSLTPSKDEHRLIISF
ncbi:MAG TPA: hypothetical protein VKN74_06665 [Candidatus Mcinerneyibacterium sp.]|nr:hypothetical protein [Candidatus Mcinerneyibacterium sp.]